MVHFNQTGSGCHQNLAETVQSHPPASGFGHATAGARDSIRKWYIKRGLYTASTNNSLAALVSSARADPALNRSATRASVAAMQRIFNSNVRWLVARNENENTATHKPSRRSLRSRAFKQSVVRAGKGCCACSRKRLAIV